MVAAGSTRSWMEAGGRATGRDGGRPGPGSMRVAGGRPGFGWWQLYRHVMAGGGTRGHAGGWRRDQVAC
jgi:hypothetical protein